MADNLVHRPKEPDGGRQQQDEEDDEDIDETGFKAVKDAVLFAIEVSPSMLQKPSNTAGQKGDASSPLMAALKAAYHLMQQRIIASPKDLIGVLLYGTEASKFYNEDAATSGGWSYPHCYLLVDLDVPEAEDVKALKQLVEDENPEQLDVVKPTSETVRMDTVLFCANQIFQQKAANFASRRLFLVTNNDNPHADNKAHRSQATVRAKDLYDLGVTIELFPISDSTRDFNRALFYDDMVYKTLPDDPDAVVYNPVSVANADTSTLKSDGTSDGIGLLQSLLSSIASKITPKRALFSSVPLEIGPGLRISVKGYLLYKHQQPARSCYIHLQGEVPEIVVGKRALEITQETVTGSKLSHEVQKADIRKAFTFGGEKITFTEEENKKLRDFGDPIIRIIGFKPMQKLPLWANTKNSTFLYPSEEAYTGSTKVYSALYQKLFKSQLFGLCWFVPRRNATPVMAAMVPTSTESGEKNVTSTSTTGAPQGLHLIPLPFADDIRQNPPTLRTPPVASDSLVDAMRPMIRKISVLLS
jgi:ATP-dependent DNA helicase 2 subunit 1